MAAHGCRNPPRAEGQAAQVCNARGEPAGSHSGEFGCDQGRSGAITAQAAPPELVGTGLAFVTSVGFGLTVVSIGVVQRADDLLFALTALAVGPALGLLGLTRAR